MLPTTARSAHLSCWLKMWRPVYILIFQTGMCTQSVKYQFKHYSTPMQRSVNRFKNNPNILQRRGCDLKWSSGSFACTTRFIFWSVGWRTKAMMEPQGIGSGLFLPTENVQRCFLTPLSSTRKFARAFVPMFARGLQTTVSLQQLKFKMKPCTWQQWEQRLWRWLSYIQRKYELTWTKVSPKV